MTCPSYLFVGSFAVAACMAPAALAADSPEETCAKLRQALTEEVELLENLRSADEVKSMLSALRRSQKKQNELFGCDESALWDYISNTDGVKQPLVELLQRLAAQLCRMEECNYYDNAELKELLYTQIVTEG